MKNHSMVHYIKVNLEGHEEIQKRPNTGILGMKLIFENKKKEEDQIKNIRNPVNIRFINDFKLRLKFKLLKEIKNSETRILSLEDNWDKEGSKAYKKESFDRAVTFLEQLYQKLIYEHDLRIQIPAIGPGPEGSIDIHWKTNKFELLLNIPEDYQELAGFYGDDYDKESIEGNLNLTSLQDVLVRWLITKE